MFAVILDVCGEIVIQVSCRDIGITYRLSELSLLLDDAAGFFECGATFGGRNWDISRMSTSSSSEPDRTMCRARFRELFDGVKRDWEFSESECWGDGCFGRFFPADT